MGWIIALIVIIAAALVAAAIAKSATQKTEEIDAIKVAVNFIAPVFDPTSQLKKISLNVSKVSGERLSPPAITGKWIPRGWGLFWKQGVKIKYLGDLKFTDSHQPVALYSNQNTLMPSHDLALGTWKVRVEVDEWVEEFDTVNPGSPPFQKVRIRPFAVEQKFEIKTTNVFRDPQGHLDFMVAIVSEEDPQSVYSLEGRGYKQVGLIP